MVSVETYKSNVIEITVTQPTPTYNVSISADKTSAYTGEVINFTVTGDVPAPPWDLHVVNGSGVEVKSDTVSGDFSLKFSIADTYSVYLTGDNGKFESNRVSITVTEAEVSLSADKTSVNVGETITFTVTSNVGYNGVFYVNGTAEKNIDSAVFTWTPQEAGTYDVYVEIYTNTGSVRSDVISIASTEEGREEEVGEGEEGGVFGFGVRQRLRDRLDKLRQRLFGSEEGSETARTRGL